MKKQTVIQVALCGPGDVAKEVDIAKRVIEAWNIHNFENTNCGIKANHWNSDVIPSMEERGQAVIDRKLIDEADLVVAIFWHRLGTPTGMYESGTAEEILRAMARDKTVLIYFSTLEAPNVHPDQEQQEKLSEFRRKARECGLPWSFRNRIEFEETFARHLNLAVLDILKKKRTVRKSPSKRAKTISQEAKGHGNVQIAGDNNSVKFSFPKQPKVVITPLSGALTPREQRRVSDWIEELCVLTETVEGKTIQRAKGEMWSRLKNHMGVAKYEQILSDQISDVERWFIAVKGQLQRKAKRKAPQAFTGARIPAIKAAMKALQRDKGEYYKEIAARLKIRPFTSLKELTPNNLDKVYNLVRRDQKRDRG